MWGMCLSALAGITLGLFATLRACSCGGDANERLLGPGSAVGASRDRLSAPLLGSWLAVVARSVGVIAPRASELDRGRYSQQWFNIVFISGAGNASYLFR